MLVNKTAPIVHLVVNDHVQVLLPRVLGHLGKSEFFRFRHSSYFACLFWLGRVGLLRLPGKASGSLLTALLRGGVWFGSDRACACEGGGFCFRPFSGFVEGEAVVVDTML